MQNIKHPLLSDPTRQTMKIMFSLLTPITSQEELTLSTSHLACPGPVNRTNSRTIFQWATSADATRHKRAMSRDQQVHSDEGWVFFPSMTPEEHLASATPRNQSWK